MFPASPLLALWQLQRRGSQNPPVWTFRFDLAEGTRAPDPERSLFRPEYSRDQLVMLQLEVVLLFHPVLAWSSPQEAGDPFADQPAPHRNRLHSLTSLGPCPNFALMCIFYTLKSSGMPIRPAVRTNRAVRGASECPPPERLRPAMAGCRDARPMLPRSARRSGLSLTGEPGRICTH